MLDDLLQKHLNPFIDMVWNSALFWRSLSLCFLLAIAGAFLFRQRILAFIQKKEHREHDAKIFAASDAILSEELFSEIIQSLLNDHSYYFKEWGPMAGFINYYCKESNQYLDSSLKDSSIEFGKSLSALLKFLQYNFFVYPPNQHEDMRLCLYPDLNPDRGGGGTAEDMKKYDKFTVELENFATDARNKYRSYRSSIKRRLYL